MSGWRTATFKVLPTDRRGWYPTPQPDNDGWHWRGDILLDSIADHDLLLTSVTHFSSDLVLGTDPPRWYFHVDDGPGAFDLTVPERSGALRVYAQAILVDVSGVSDSRRGPRYACSVDFAWPGDPAP